MRSMSLRDILRSFFGTKPSAEKEWARIFDNAIQAAKTAEATLATEREHWKAERKRLGLEILNLSHKLSDRKRGVHPVPSAQPTSSSVLLGKLSRGAVRFLRKESAGREMPESWVRTLSEAEGMVPEIEWSNLSDDERRSVMAYLADDSEEYAEHRKANLVVLSILLILENRRLRSGQ